MISTHSHVFSSYSLSPTFCQNGHCLTGHIFYRLQVQDLPGEPGVPNKHIQSMGIPGIPCSPPVTVMHQPSGTPEILKRGELRQMKLMSLRSSREVQGYLSSVKDKCHGDQNNCPRMMQVGLDGMEGTDGVDGKDEADRCDFIQTPCKV